MAFEPKLDWIDYDEKDLLNPKAKPTAEDAKRWEQGIYDSIYVNPKAGMERQAIIDGNFQIAQVCPVVGTEVTDPASNAYPVFDLYKIDCNADGGIFPTIKHSQQLITSGAVPNSKYCYRVNVNGAGSGLGSNSLYRIQYHSEHGTQNLCGANKKVTVSFYARTTIGGTKKMATVLEQYYGTGGSPSIAEGLGVNIFTLSSSWQKFTFTWVTNTLSGKTFGTNNDDWLALYFWLEWGGGLTLGTAETFVGAGDIEIAQLELCAGEVALPFCPRSFVDELKDCQVYLRDLHGEYPLSYVNGADNLRFAVDNRIQSMRITPSILNLGTYGVDWDIADVSNGTSIAGTVTMDSGLTDGGTTISIDKTSHGITGNTVVLRIYNKNKIFVDVRF